MGLPVAVRGPLARAQMAVLVFRRFHRIDTTASPPLSTSMNASSRIRSFSSGSGTLGSAFHLNRARESA